MTGRSTPSRKAIARRLEVLAQLTRGKRKPKSAVPTKKHPWRVKFLGPKAPPD